MAPLAAGLRIRSQVQLIAGLEECGPRREGLKAAKA
jgi:hypothetical protein